MYRLIVKASNRECAVRFTEEWLGDGVVRWAYPTQAEREWVVMAESTSTRDFTRTLGQWFAGDVKQRAPYPDGTLLWYKDVIVTPHWYKSEV